MKYVVDASVALREVLPGPLTGKAQALKTDFLNKIHELLAPDIFPAETASALTKAERQKLSAVGDGAAYYAKLASAWPDLRPYYPLIGRAMDISSQTRSSFLDCLYITLTEQEQYEFITADDKLVNNLQKQFPLILHLNAMP